MGGATRATASPPASPELPQPALQREASGGQAWGRVNSGGTGSSGGRAAAGALVAGGVFGGLSEGFSHLAVGGSGGGDAAVSLGGFPTSEHIHGRETPITPLLSYRAMAMAPSAEHQVGWVRTSECAR